MNLCECENDRKIINKQIFINNLFWRKSDDDLKLMIFVLNFIFEELVAFNLFEQLKNKKRFLNYFKLTFHAQKRVFLNFGKLQRISIREEEPSVARHIILLVDKFYFYISVDENVVSSSFFEIRDEWFSFVMRIPLFDANH